MRTRASVLGLSLLSLACGKTVDAPADAGAVDAGIKPVDAGPPLRTTYRAIGGVSGGTYLFALPGSTGAVKDAWDDILVHQLDARFRPCNLVELMPRLLEHLRAA